MQFFSLPDHNDFISKITLDDTIYWLKLSWNDRGQFWKFGLLDQNKNVLFDGVKCVTNYPLLEQIRPILPIPNGEFMVFTFDKNSAIGRNDFVNKRCVLAYLSSSEVTLYGGPV